MMTQRIEEVTITFKMKDGREHKVVWSEVFLNELERADIPLYVNHDVAERLVEYGVGS